jgi:large subunit ribosomal protein L1
MGKRSFTPQQLEENVLAFIGKVQTMKPSTSKGNFLLKGTLSATQTAGIGLKI